MQNSASGQPNQKVLLIAEADHGKNCAGRMFAGQTPASFYLFTNASFAFNHYTTVAYV
jgi:hypothetical protein